MFTRKALAKVVRQRFVVFCHDGMVFSGALLEYDDTTFVFGMVRVHRENEATMPVEGPIYIDRTKVGYLQKVSVHDAAG